MTQPSPPELRILHATRLLGLADESAVADRARVSYADAVTALRDAEGRGFTQEVAFADLRGWSLTADGRAENERQLARERERVDPGNRIRAVYREFLPLNARLVRACTDWQIRPTAHDPFAPNDHADHTWDRRVLAELAALSENLAPIIARLATMLTRFGCYNTRFAAALRRAQSGEHDWVDSTSIDSCHRVWFELHEDLVATLGIDRSTENSSDPH